MIEGGRGREEVEEKEEKEKEDLTSIHSACVRTIGNFFLGKKREACEKNGAGGREGERRERIDRHSLGRAGVRRRALETCSGLRSA